MPLLGGPAITIRKPRMMRQYELIDRVKQYNPATNEDLLNRAYVYAMQAHGKQQRDSGDPYFSHPLEVAAILTDLKPEIRSRSLQHFYTRLGANFYSIHSLFHALYGERQGVRVARKHIGWYTKGLSGSAAFRFRLNQLPSIAEQRDAIDTYFESLAVLGAPNACPGDDSEELAA